MGIHKDDIQISKNDIDAKKVASQGQIKTILYALRLAQAECISKKNKKKIIFSIDDFSDRLDEERRHNLFHLLPEIDFVSQWFITDVEEIKTENNIQEIFIK